jgi:hypothetical protein
MALARKSKKRTADDLVVAIESFGIGPHGLVREGDVVLRDDPAVGEKPESFVPFLSTSGERAEARARLIAQYHPEPPQPEPAPPEPATSGKMVRALRGMRVGGALTPAGARPDVMTIVQEGEVLPEDLPIVRQNGELFEKV